MKEFLLWFNDSVNELSKTFTGHAWDTNNKQQVNIFESKDNDDIEVNVDYRADISTQLNVLDDTLIRAWIVKLKLEHIILLNLSLVRVPNIYDELRTVISPAKTITPNVLATTLEFLERKYKAMASLSP